VSAREGVELENGIVDEVRLNQGSSLVRMGTCSYDTHAGSPLPTHYAPNAVGLATIFDSP
jgi:hypothetical protein